MLARRDVADVVRHRRRARREDRDIGAALALEFQLRALQAAPNLIVRNIDGALRSRARGMVERRNLRVTIGLQRFRRGRVVAVTVNHHFTPAPPPLPARHALPALVPSRARCDRAAPWWARNWRRSTPARGPRGSR